MNMNEFVISRTFSAPRELVWKAWSEAENMAKWWGPKGSNIKIRKFEFNPGGEFHYAMDFAGNDLWGKFVYREIKSPEKIVFVNSFADAFGNITRAPFSTLWPQEVLNNVTFEEVNSKTILTLRLPH